MRVYSLLLLFGLHFLTSDRVPGQTVSRLPAPVFKTRSLTIDNGLSQNMIFSMLQDGDGFIWIGTKDGLNRYDGHEFRIYRTDPSDPTSISNNYVTALMEDDEGSIWVGTVASGVNVFDRRTERFRRFTLGGSTELRSAGTTTNKIVDAGRAILVFSDQGLDRIDKRSGAIFSYGPKHGFRYDGAVWAVPDTGRCLWIGQGTRIDHFNPETDTFLPMEAALHRRSGLVPTFLARDPAGRLWAATPGELHRLSDDLSRLATFKIPGPLPAREEPKLAFEGGRIWYNRVFSLLVLDPEKGTWSDPALPAFVTTILTDRSGVVWIGTSAAGVLVHDPKREFFRHYTGAAHRTLFPDIMERLKRASGRPDALDRIRLQSICQTSEGDVWIGTLREGLFRFSGRSGSVHRYLPPRPREGGHDSREALVVVQDSLGTIWASSDNRVCRYVPERDALESITIVPPSEYLPYFRDLSGSNVITSIYRGREGPLWVGTATHGLVAIDPATGERRSFRHHAEDVHSLSSDFVLTLAEDPTNPAILWVGTDGGGLTRVDTRTGGMTRLGSTDGLPNGVMYGILPDHAGMLWLSSNRGIVRLDPRSMQFTAFDVHDGLQSNEFNRGEFMGLRSGELVFGGIAGFNIFHPAEVRPNPHAPPVALTDLRLFNRSVVFGTKGSPLSEPIGVAERITLDHRQNMFSIRFAALEYSAPDRNRFSYRLEGFDTTWVAADEDRMATFTNLDPGTYVFHVRASNNDGAWNEEGRRLLIEILPPFWLTWWFRTLVLTALFVAVGGSIRAIEISRIRRRMLELEHAASLERERLRIAQDMHDDLGARLTEVGLVSSMARRNVNDPNAMDRALSEIAGASERIVSSFDEIVWAVNPYHDTLESLVDYLAQYAVGYVERAGMTPHIEIPRQIPGTHISSHVRHATYMVLKEALNNAVKYSGAGGIHLKFAIEPAKLILRIWDDGRGFDLETTGRHGDGLANMRRRMSDVGGVCTIESATHKGTLVEASIPIDVTTHEIDQTDD